jgi:hypothetical protein
VPAASDVALLTQSDAIHRTATYTFGPAGDAALQAVINASGPGNITLLQSGGTFSTPQMVLASTGRGSFFRSAGRTQIGSLLIGNNASGDGSFTSVGGTLSVSGAFRIGNNGAGTFLQNAGFTTSAVNVSLGDSVNSTGYAQVEAGNFSTNQILVGNRGAGTFVQTQVVATLGTVDVTSLRIGVLAGGVGTYQLTSGNLSAESVEVGVSGTGHVVHMGNPTQSTLTCDVLSLGSTASGTGRYDLSAGTLDVRETVVVGGTGTGVFNQTGGLLKVANSLQIGSRGQFTGGNISGGSIVVSTGGTFNVASLGGGLNVNRFVQNGGGVTGALTLNDSNYTYNGGVFAGRLTLRNTASLTLNADFTAGDGIDFFETAQTLPAGRSVTLNGNGLSLHATQLAMQSTLNASRLQVGGWGGAQTGSTIDQVGDVTVSGDTILGTQFGAGTYLLSSGSATAGLAQLFIGSATFSAATGQLIVSGGSLNVTATTRVDRGAVQQTGGDANLGEIINNAALLLTGGTTSAGNIDGSGSISMTGSGSLTANRVRQVAVTVTGTTAGLAIRPNGADSGVSRVGSLDLGAPASGTISGKIDLANNHLVVDYDTTTSPLATLRAYIASGYDAGAWNGAGITTSMGNTSTSALGYAEAGDIFTTFPATFSGQSVDDTTVLVRFTRYGDANLDQVVNLTDFNRLAANFGTSSGATWSMGDFTYDGIVNLSDFNRLAANFGLSAGPDGVVDPQDWALLASAVPEPTGAIASVLLLTCRYLIRRRRRD